MSYVLTSLDRQLAEHRMILYWLTNQTEGIG